MTPLTPLDHWMKLFKAPFIFKYGIIFDAESNIVADAHHEELTKGNLRTRGWGRISSYTMTICKDQKEADRLACEIQDAGTKWIAEAMNEHYNRSKEGKQ